MNAWLSWQWVARSKMMTTLRTKVLANGFSRLEAPMWHVGALWVSDTGAGKVYRCWGGHLGVSDRISLGPLTKAQIRKCLTRR
jgi:hypothetical protein